MANGSLDQILCILKCVYKNIITIITIYKNCMLIEDDNIILSYI